MVLKRLVIRVQVWMGQDRLLGWIDIPGDSIGGTEEARRKWYPLDGPASVSSASDGSSSSYSSSSYSSGGKLLCKLAWQHKYIKSPTAGAGQQRRRSGSQS